MHKIALVNQQRRLRSTHADTMKAIILIVLVTVVCPAELTLVQTDKICAVTRREIKSESESIDDIGDVFNTSDYNQTETIKFERCNQYCYALWKEESTSNGTKINIFLQGCWNQEGQECENTECIANSWAKAISHAKFCCCNEDYCNVNFTDPFENKMLLTSPPSKENLSVIRATELLEQIHPNNVLLPLITLVGILFATLSVISLLYALSKTNIFERLTKPVPYNDNYIDGNGLRTGTYTVDHLKLSTIVGQGRYGSVWQGSMGDQEVAVKIFPGHYQNYFANERDIYCLPFMDHSSLLHYYGSDERVSMDCTVEYLLVFSYAPGGTLKEFLQYHTFDWITFCKMGLSIVKGLAYLHTDIRKGDKFKPCIAHRDMNTTNILLKADGTCCICDLGLAVQISGSKYFANGEEQHAETKSINDVGTLQYMAPEVLEGAVNLRDCESSLKQIDVYAMGIILWELVSRCTNIYVPSTEIPSYRQPFEKEIGLNPTFDQMQVLVSRNKARPLFEGSLADKPGVRLIRETMEDCWDADAEARLTALCIEERLMELQSHRITMYFTDGSPMMNSHCGLVPSTTNSLYNDAPHHAVQMNGHDCNDTIDTLVTFSPSENSSHEQYSSRSKNSNETNAASWSAHNQILNSQQQAQAQQSQPQLQPYQGRNPCMERNLMLQSDSCEELGCQGNILVNKSSKHHTDKLPQLASTSSETQSLVPHDYLGQQQQQHQPSQQQHHHHVISSQQLSLRSITPIPYVQNVISECSGSNSSYNKLKQTNIQESYYTALPINPQDSSPKRRRFSGWVNLKKILASKKMMYQNHHPAYSKCEIDREDSKSNLLANKNTAAAAVSSHQPKIVETNVSISPGGKYVNGIVKEKNRSDASFVHNTSSIRPSTLPLVCLRRSSNDSKKTCETSSLSRQDSLDKFNESSSSIAKDTLNLNQPATASFSYQRKTRAKNMSAATRLSLYDDRIMCSITNDEKDKKVSDSSNPSSSNSVPFSMDVTDDQQHGMSGKFDTKNVTCF